MCIDQVKIEVLRSIKDTPYLNVFEVKINNKFAVITFTSKTGVLCIEEEFLQKVVRNFRIHRLMSINNVFQLTLS